VRRLQDHDSLSYYVHGLAFSPDSKRLATSNAGHGWGGSHDGGVLLWDTASGKLLRELKTSSEGVGRVAVSPDGHWLAAQTRSGVRVWDLRSGRESAANEAAHRGSIWQVVVARGGLMATSGDDHTVRLWDAATGKQRHALRHLGSVASIALSPDGSKLVSSSSDDAVRLWDTAGGKVIYKLPGHGRLGRLRRPVAFTPNGKRFLSFGDDFDLRVWDVATGKALLEHAVRPAGVAVPEDNDSRYNEERFSLLGESALTPDGKRLVVNVGNSLRLFDTEGKEGRTLLHPGGYVLALAVSPDSKMVLVSSSGKPVETKLPGGGIRQASARSHPVCLWDLGSGELVRQHMIPENGAEATAFSADGKLYAAAAWKRHAEVILWETASGKEVRRLDHLPGRVSALAFAPGGKRLATGMQDGSVLVWELAGR
jgi:WD40 repeat protein